MLFAHSNSECNARFNIVLHDLCQTCTCRGGIACHILTSLLLSLDLPLWIFASAMVKCIIICITCLYYSVLVEIVCCVHVFALCVDIKLVLLLLCSLTLYMF